MIMITIYESYVVLRTYYYVAFASNYQILIDSMFIVIINSFPFAGDISLIYEYLTGYTRRFS